MELLKNHSLLTHNTFGVDVKAKYFIPVISTADLPAILDFIQANDSRVLVLGEGSNILFTKDFDGIILHMQIEGIHVVKEDDEYYWVKAGGGIQWHELVMNTLQAGMTGLENLSLIPGTVGAAPVQNIGAYGAELRDVMEALEAFDLTTGEKIYFKNEECEFGYRDSIFKNELKGRFLITNVVFRLNKKPGFNLSYEPLRKKILKSGKGDLTADDISSAVMEIRRNKLPDPTITGNAGSFFKNPIVDNSFWENLRKTHTSIPGHPVTDTHVKIPAAWLIEQCGWKGKRFEHAGVHDQQALVLINTGSATGAEILSLSKKIQSSVKSKFGIALSPEIRIL